jgi:hypothetical protein
VNLSQEKSLGEYVTVLKLILVGAGNMAFFGGVVGNITALVAELGSSGLPGLVAVGIILWLFQR